MKLEELVNKEDLTNEEVLEYYEVDSLKSLEMMIRNRIVEKGSSLEIDGDILYSGLEAIYSRLVESNFNTIQEDVMFYGVILNAAFDFDLDEVFLLMYTLTPFNLAFILDEELSEFDFVKYYRRKYNQFIERKTNITFLAEDFLGKVATFIEENLKDISEEDIEKMAEKAELLIEKMQNKQ